MNKCEIVKDLIPLYVENLTNESSNNLTKKHLEQCSDCKAYYEMVKEDYSKNYNKKQNEGKADVVVEKLVKYQRNIKLISVLVGMFMSCIIMGARVQFLSTIPFLLITPFICRLFYQRSWPIILSSIPFALVGALLSGENSSFIPFFIVLALIFTSMGVLAAVVLKHGFNQLKIGQKVSYTIIALVV
ncbi:MAG TPA: zf-HC2 domain-containing protein, partial [Clostridia bacterium]|nr:zf-HC2 domain-containing protein [Clostridia bacterium]